jgi:hypothetical protein
LDWRWREALPSLGVISPFSMPSKSHPRPFQISRRSSESGLGIIGSFPCRCGVVEPALTCITARTSVTDPEGLTRTFEDVVKDFGQIDNWYGQCLGPFSLLMSVKA